MMLKKTTKLTNGNLMFAYWANNRGRGRDNCTLQIVPAGTTRAPYSRLNKTVICSTRTSSWNGHVNLSERVCAELGIKKTDIVIE